MNFLKKAAIAAAMALSIGGIALAASYTKTDNIISSTGGPVGIPGGLTQPGTAVGDMYAAISTITPVAVTNLSTTIASPTFTVERNGKIVKMFGIVNLAPVTSGTLTTFTLSLPVARTASFIGVGGAVGSARVAASYSSSGTCNGSANSLTKLTCSYTAGTINADSVLVSVTYSLDGN